MFDSWVIPSDPVGWILLAVVVVLSLCTAIRAYVGRVNINGDNRE